MANIEVILNLLSVNDEYFLMLLLTKLFKSFKGYKNITDKELFILKNFYLGYCGSDKQTYDIS